MLLPYGWSNTSSMVLQVYSVFLKIVGIIIQKNVKLFERLKKKVYLCMLFVQSIVYLVLPLVGGLVLYVLVVMMLCMM